MKLQGAQWNHRRMERGTCPLRVPTSLMDSGARFPPTHTLESGGVGPAPTWREGLGRAGRIWGRLVLGACSRLLLWSHSPFHGVAPGRDSREPAGLRISTASPALAGPTRLSAFNRVDAAATPIFQVRSPVKASKLTRGSPGAPLPCTVSCSYSASYQVALP